MTRMRNIFLGSAAMIAALVMTMSSCSNEELTEDNGQPEMKGISSVTLETPQNGPSTRLEYNIDNITNGLGVKWKAGYDPKNEKTEKGVCINAAHSLLYGTVFVRTDDGGAASKAVFSFYTPDLTSLRHVYSGSIGLLYPYKKDYAGTFDVNGSSDNSIGTSLTLSGQSGRLADVENFDYMTAMAAVSSDMETDAGLNIVFKHRIAIMRLIGLTFPDGIGSTATNVSISGTGLMTDAKLTFTKGANNTLTQSLELGITEGAITTTGSFNITNHVLEDVYICFFPGNAYVSGTYKITDLKVTATVGSDTYEYDYGNDTTVPTKVTKFKEGKMYTLKGKNMTK